MHLGWLVGDFDVLTYLHLAMLYYILGLAVATHKDVCDRHWDREK
jgi:hypothetical protein